MDHSEAASAAPAIVVSRGTSTTGDPLNIFGDLIYVKLAGKDTQGRLCLMEDVTQPGEGPPLHVHHREDEGFYVLDGDYRFEVDGRQMDAHTGDFFYVRRDIPHTFQNTGSKPGRLLLTLEPAGLEDFFAELSRIEGPPLPEKVVPVFAKYGLELLGPPLAAR